MDDMNRRELLAAAGGLAMVAAAPALAFAAEKGHAEHTHGRTANAAIAKTAYECVQAAEVCLRHCIAEFGKGNPGMTDAALSVYELKISCSALASFADFNSPHLPEMMTLSMKVCEESEKECKKYPNMPEFVECANACRKCIDACKPKAA